MRNFMFTSESVTEGHPDKMCDIISDAIVDHLLAQDPCAKVRAECAVHNAIVFIAARFSASANIDFSQLTRRVIQQIGYDRPDFNPSTCSILSTPQALPLDKSRQFNEHDLSEAQIGRIPVRNQVTLFGYACDHTPELMPLPIVLAHRLAMGLMEVRRGRHLPYLMPEGKVQVGIDYQARRPVRIHSVTITASQQYEMRPPLSKLRSDIRSRVVDPVLAAGPLQADENTRIIINPDGTFLGGPSQHSGLTGRKNAIDTYGEYTRHSGKALSGKDPMRIDRIGAYAARHAAKNIVAAGLAAECEVMLSYSVGLTKPVSLQVQTFGTGTASDEAITALVERHFDFRLAGILRDLNLRHLPAQHPRGFYQKLAAYGHFGRSDMELPWEQTDRAEVLRQA